MPKVSAIDKLMIYLAIRDHSEYELKQKLRKGKYEAQEIAEAIAFAHEHKYILEPAVLSEKTKLRLDKSLKGKKWIQGYLRKKALPMPVMEDEIEWQKAKLFVELKLGWQAPYDYEQQKKIASKLQSRGFSPDCIRKVIYEGR